MRLSSHFTLDELTASDTAKKHGLDNAVHDMAVLANLQRLAAELEKVRALAGKLLRGLGHDGPDPPLHVLSGYRAPAVNAKVGGSKASAHMDGRAADFDPPPGLTHDALQQAIVADPAIAADLVLEERAKDGAHWLHFQVARPGVNPRRLARDAELERLGGPITRVTAS